MSNYLGIQIFKAFPGAKTGPLSPKCKKILGVGGGNNAQSLQPFSLDVEWTNDSFVGQQEVILANNDQSVTMMDRLGESEERDNQLQQSLHRIDLAVAAIEKKLDIVPDPKISKSKKSKKSKAVKPNSDAGEVQEEEEESTGIFERKLLETGGVGDEKAEVDNDEMKRSIVAMERKLNSVEKEIKTTGIAMKDEVKGIKEEVKGMKGKVDKIEKSMEELKDMLSQLVMGGGAVAE